MTWKKIMAYAHQGVELKQIPGAPPSPGPVGPQVAAAPGARPGDEIPRPALLTRRGADVLVRIERALEDASRALVKPASDRTAGADAPAPAAAPPVTRPDGKVAATEGRGTPRVTRGN
jgi:penicillin-binding protein 1A